MDIAETNRQEIALSVCIESATEDWAKESMGMISHPGKNYSLVTFIWADLFY